MEQQSPTPERPDDVKPAVAPPPDAVTPVADAPGSPAAAPPAAGSPAAAPPAPPLTPMGWLQQNSAMLAAGFAIVALLYYYGGLDAIFRAGLVAVGLGLLIFIHELGHFLAAKWCNVHVQTFSLGFGPALPGCSFRWGETTYKIGVLPLGGFVQMVGEGAEAEEDENYPRSYKNKTVFQRMFIISAGVVMNVLLGFVCFAVVYQFHGVEMPPAAVAATDAGSPAWQEGIPSGSVFTKIGSTPNPTFEDLRDNVALTWWEAPVPIEYKVRGDDQVRTASILPRRDANDIQPVIGVSPPYKLVLLAKKWLPEDYEGPAHHGSAAAAARVIDLHPGDVVLQASDPSKDADPVTDLPHDSPAVMFDALCERMRDLGGRELVLMVRRADAPAESGPVTVRVPAKGFESDDIIEGTTDPKNPDNPYEVASLKPRPDNTGGADRDVYDFQERMRLLASRPAVVRVLRELKGPNEAVTSSLVNVLVPPAFHRKLGLKMKMGEVAAIRNNSPASGLVRPGDKIVGASVNQGGERLGKDLKELKELAEEDEIDPVRLPYELEKRVDLATDRSKVQVVLTVRRHDADSLGDKDTTVTLPWDDHWRFDQELPFSPASPMSIPELGVAYHVESSIAQVEAMPPSPASKANPPLMSNDRIEEICFKEGGKWGYWHTMKAKRVKDGATVETCDEWPHYFTAFQSYDSPDVQVRVWRNTGRLPNDIEMTAVEDRTWPLTDRGLILTPETRLQKADNVLQAVGMGVGRTWAFIRQIYQGMVSMLTGRIDAASNVEGPLNIARHTFQAAADPFSLILILGMISVNLAVVNFLPIPVLDGGHMVFLIYELVRRKPPSDTVRAIASYVGLAALGTLMLFVIYLDVSHWIWGGGR